MISGAMKAKKSVTKAKILPLIGRKNLKYVLEFSSNTSIIRTCK